MARYLGIDLGGSYLKFVFSPDGNATHTGKIDIRQALKTNNLASLTTSIKKIVLQFQPDALGVAVAGLLDFQEQKITHSPNIPLFNQLPLAQILKEKLSLPVYLENDANCAALGEWNAPLHPCVDSMITVTLGTGLGAGLIYKGHIFHGHQGSALEPGHTIIEKDGWNCRCGRQGCLEAYCSSYGLEEHYFHRSAKRLSSHKILLQARENEASALKSLEDFCAYLSLGLTNILHLFNPAALILAGGIVQHYPPLLGILRSSILKLAEPVTTKDLYFNISAHGELSGAFGALALAKQNFTKYSK